MTCSITYPAAGGDGAVDGNDNLVSCCGDWLRPAGTAGPCKVYAKIYPTTGPVDANPIPGNPDFTEGTLVPDPNGDSGTFHFNESGIPGAGTGGTYRVKIWITADDVNFEPFGPRSFDGCVYGDSDCDSPHCLSDPEMPAGGDDNVIDQIAPVKYHLGPDQRIVELFEVAKSLGAGELAFKPVELTYSLSDSSPARAVWLAAGLEQPNALRLEVKRGSCGCLTATLSAQRVSEAGIEPALRWRSEEFSLVGGGVLEAISPRGQCAGGCLRVSVPPAKKAGLGKKPQHR
jgi:hypothetical protein